MSSEVGTTIWTYPELEALPVGSRIRKNGRDMIKNPHGTWGDVDSDGLPWSFHSTRLILPWTLIAVPEGNTDGAG